MHLGISELGAFLESKRSSEHLVLAVITGAEGSTYRKPGAMMLIAPDGSYGGLISGGCLEGDLLKRAQAVFADGTARTVHYDLASEEAILFGVGTGCEGAVDLLLCRFSQEDDFSTLGRMVRMATERQTVSATFVVAGNSQDFQPGDHALHQGSQFLCGSPSLESWLPDCESDSHSRWLTSTVDGTELISITIVPPPQVLVCGAGPDAIPLVHLLIALGWDVIVVDHRSDFAQTNRFPKNCRVVHCFPKELESYCDLTRLNAAVIMNHHLDRDREYLRLLAPYSLSYLGALGPEARRRRLQNETDTEHQAIYGPAGLDIGAELPASIALSIAAEIHAVLNQRTGSSLSNPSGHV